MEVNLFHWADYAVFIILLLVSAGIGIFYGIKDRKAPNPEEYLVGGRSMHVLPVSISIFVSYTSAITFLGEPVEAYTFGAGYLFVILGLACAIPWIAEVFAPFYHSQNLISAFELLWMAIVLYAPSLALSQVSGLPIWAAIVGVGGICTFYTTLGGIKAEIWADAVQVCVMLVGQILIIVFGIIRIGSIGEVMDIASKGGRTSFGEFSFNPFVRSSIMSYFLTGWFKTLIPYTATQPCIQKYCAVPTERHARLSVYLTFPMYGGAVILFYLIGMIMYALYHDCDPLKSGMIERPDQLLPFAVMDVLGFMPGVPGLFISCIFSASLSTISSGLNGMAANILSDAFKPWYTNKYKKPVPDKLATFVCKVIAILFGGITICLGFAIMMLGSSVFVITGIIVGILGGPLVGAFILGVQTVSSTSAGTMGAIVASTILSMWIGIGSFVYKYIPTTLPRSIDGCVANTVLNDTMSYMLDNMTMSTSTATIDSGTQQPFVPPEEESFTFLHIYRWSPAMYPFLSVSLCVIIGLILSFIDNLGRKCRSVHTEPERVELNQIPTFRTMHKRSLRKKRKSLKRGAVVERGVQFPSDTNIYTGKITLPLADENGERPVAAEVERLLPSYLTRDINI